MNVARLRNREGKIWLNVASGHYVLEDFVNLDNSILLTLSGVYSIIRPLIKPGHRPLFQNYRDAASRATLLRHDCRKPLDLPAASVDHILSSHFLEHIYPPEASAILDDFFRVLRPGGTLHVIVPGLDAMIDEYLAMRGNVGAADSLMSRTILTHERRPSLKYRVLEFLGYEGMKHRWLYDLASIQAKVQAAGFRILEENTTPSAHVRADDLVTNLHVVAQKD
jgi:predicted SAM-dependent methyltransferase